jgi:acyl-CoA synthetase (AMP-forming)/AMP-acid ligase II
MICSLLEFPSEIMEKPILSSPVVSGAVGCMEDVLAIERRVPQFPGNEISTYDLLKQGLSSAPESAALSFFLRSEDYEQPFTWNQRQWLGCIMQAANMFRRLGLQRGDVVAFVLPNLPETHLTIWGGEAAGIVFPINPLLEAPMMLELLNAAKPKLVVTLASTPGSDLWERVSPILNQVDSLAGVLTVNPLRYLPGSAGLALGGGGNQAGQLGNLPVMDFHAEFLGAREDRLEFDPPCSDDVASYFCTGGTTGTPKIAVRTHRTEVANALEVAATAGQELASPGTVVFCGLPLFHVNAQIVTGLLPWATGAHVILGTSLGYRAPGLVQNFWKLVEHYKLNWFSGVPTIYSSLLQVPRGEYDISSVRYGVCGAAPMPKELITRFQREAGIKILEGYGLTEAGCASTLNPVAGECKVGSIGLRLPWQDVRAVLVSPTGAYLRDAAVGQAGTIVIKGPNLFKGYLNPVHNQGLWLDIPDAQGNNERWLNTGDLGYVDEQGYFWLTGRAKELIIRGGHNIDPKMIEEPMHTHPAVAMAAAVGRPDAHAGEIPVLYVQLRPGVTASEDELMSYARQTVAEKAALPKYIHIVSSLPMTAVGKIFKPALAMSEMESIVREEAAACGLVVRHCQAVRDERKGVVLNWSVEGDPGELISRLEKYSFSHEMV